MLRKLSIYAEHLLQRDKYLEDFNQRIDHFKDVQGSTSNRVIDEAIDADHEAQFAIPETTLSELNVDFIRRSMRTAGCFIVRDVFSEAESARLRGYVDHAFHISGKETSANNYLSKQVDLENVMPGTRADIREKIKTNKTYSNTAKLGSIMRRTLAQTTSCLTISSPITCSKLLDAFDSKGLKAIITQYFQNEPCVSVYKWALRKAVSPDHPIDFHQDGSFMGADIDSINCWLALTDCGTGHTAPGLDVAPIRLKDTFGLGTGILDWTTSWQTVIDKFGEEAIVTPSFTAGDAFFFDHLLLHRTQHVEDAKAVRYAVETWFFDSQNFPKNQIPIRW